MSAVEKYWRERLRRGPDVDGLTADAAIAELEAENERHIETALTAPAGTWRYQATHRTITTPGGEIGDVFEVREVYEGVCDRSGCSWTESAIAPESDTADGLIEVLQMMLKDVQEFDVLEVGE